MEIVDIGAEPLPEDLQKQLLMLEIVDIGAEPLPEDLQKQLLMLLEYIDNNYELEYGVSLTSLHWQFSAGLNRALRMKHETKS